MTAFNTAEYTANTKLAMARSGVKTDTIIGTFVKASGTDGDVLTLGRELAGGDIILAIEAQTPVITGGTDYDFGFAKSDGTVIDKDVLADGVTFAAAFTGKDILGTGLTFDTTKTIDELCGKEGDSTVFGGYNLIMTANTAGTGTGLMKFVISVGKGGMA